MPSQIMQCSYFHADKCKSCSWLDRSYEAQLTAKSDALRTWLDPFVPQDWREPVVSPEMGFRNKAKMAVLGTVGAPLLGIRNHKGIDLSLCACPLYPVDMQELLLHLQDWIREAALPPYDVGKRQGELKFILLTQSRFSGEYMLRFVVRSTELIPRIQNALPQLLRDYNKITVVSVNIQPLHMAILEGDKEVLLTEQNSLREQFNDVPLYMRPKSFFQTNPTVAAELYKTASAWASDMRSTTIVDLFCGVGGFGLHCAASGATVTGIEIEPEAIVCAKMSAHEMGLRNVSFHSSDSILFSAAQVDVPNLVIVNPPRRGLGQALCEKIVALSPQTILYSSCKPETLVRDLSDLPNYQITRVQLFDMFPHTPHYETLIALQRRNPNKI